MNKTFFYKRVFIPICFLISLLFLVGCGKNQNFDYIGHGYTSVVTFQFNGGTMTNGVTEISSHIKYAYQPDTKIASPESFAGCNLKREGYTLEGWYKDEQLTERWNFEIDKIENNNITLYAKWTLDNKYYYALVYVDDVTKKEVELYRYPVKEGNLFSDYLNKAKREGYTTLGFYQDLEKDEPWNEKFTHPGGEMDTTIKVYVKYIQGDYRIVRTYNDLNNAKGENIYLLNDIDCKGEYLNFGDYKKEFQGNHHTISNFKVKAPAGLRPQYGIFRSLADGAKIINVAFQDVTIESPENKIVSLKIAALAGTTTGNVVVSNVQVTGKIVIKKDLQFRDQELDNMECKLTEAFVVDDNEQLVIEKFEATLVLVDERS